ncbi:ABC transporter ATP-binding protein [Arthrobacter tumbae]|uniref:ABC transporter ATP-binding protein n=1 Tax=Arthrobacter tumbae TaxID=163874 RepID=UPI00195D94B1|nr:ABC transporter ATP-binding protein [Arthrobacter tumbae]MBM7781877.1 ATP-binding cassette subfamily B protein [Arthrobacter tumbae]
MNLNTAHPVRALASAARPYRRRICAALLFNVLKDSPLWVIPVITALVIDTVVQGEDLRRLALLIGIAILVLAQNYPNHILYVRLYSRVYRSIAADLRNRLTEHLQELSIGYHNRKSAAVIQNKLVRDVENVELLMQQVFPVCVLSINLTIGAITVTALQAPAFLLVFALTVPLGAALVAGMRRRALRRNEDFRRRVEDLSDRVGEMATLIPITRAHGLEHTATRRVAATSEDVKQAGLVLDRLNSRFETTSWVSFNVLATLCLGLAGWAAITGFLPISAGQVVLLSTYFATLTAAITQLIGLAPIYTKGIESVRSILEVLGDPDLEENEGKETVPVVTGRITFEQVSYSFPDDSVKAIKNFSLDIAVGETVAFVGASGSGKSTTINLLLGFIRPTEGRILLDGRDMHDLDLRTFRQFVSVVPQESVLFEGSIFDNITYGMEDANPPLVRQALEHANAAEIVDALPDGWNTFVGQRGARLSGGQRQRLTIARALIRDPRILVLDEATSALDSASELKVKDALETLMRGRTSLVVAHRLSTIRNADRIVVLDQGRMVEVGSHDTLISLDGHYARLHRAQAV